MLREGLTAEFPFAGRAIGAVRAWRPRAHRERPLWAAISGFGAGWIVSTVGQVLVSPFRLAGLRDAAAILAGAVVVLGAAAALALAWRAGGRRGLLTYLALLVSITALRWIATIPGLLTFCSRTGDPGCIDARLMALAASEARTLAGLVLGAVAVRAVGSSGRGTNPLLAGAGAYSLAVAVEGSLLSVSGLASPDPAVGTALIVAIPALAGFVAGVVLRARATAWPRPALLLAGFLLFFWAAVQLPLRVTSGPVPGPFDLVYTLLGPIEAAAVLVGAGLPLPGREARRTAREG